MFNKSMLTIKSAKFHSIFSQIAVMQGLKKQKGG